MTVLAGGMGWLLFAGPGDPHLVVSGDTLGWDAALAVLSGFFVGAAQAAVLTAHSVAGERAAVRYWIGVTVMWVVIWPAWLAATPAIATGHGPAVTLLWRALPWLIFGASSGAWLLAPARFSPQTAPDGGGTPRLPTGGRRGATTQPAETLSATRARCSAIATSHESEAA